MNAYVASGYVLTFGGLLLYAARLVLRRRLLERNFPSPAGRR